MTFSKLPNKIMKIILSRKGFDAGSGGFPNPILPSGRPCMLPIPDRLSPLCFRDIAIQDDSLPKSIQSNLGTMVAQLTNRNVSPLRRVHLDPDLDVRSLPRQAGWRPAFGQRGAALAHLQKQGIGAGDLFLFFGWFKQTEVVDGRLRYQQDAPDLHLFFGWLQVASIIAVDAGTEVPPWLADHPHAWPSFREASRMGGNALFVAAVELTVGGRQTGVAGGGHFAKVLPTRQLTKPDSASRSLWQLPSWFYPNENQPPLTYHGDLGRWNLGRDAAGKKVASLQSVGRGQEFVLEGAAYPEAEEWLLALMGL